ncbi:GrpB family protein [Lentzea sp. NPDC060358]|uniref:GrpB family protein n=1 Tax=Lentzea sp. NPDC060358 TaxID=3347103 RepID=UPI00364EB836
MKIELAEYDPAWPGLFERERGRVVAALPGAEVEHVGSTSVPGLCAKPVVDLMLVVGDAADEASYVPVLEAAGYRVVVREDEWHHHRVVKGPDTNINLHVFSRGCAQVRRHLVFRDWLRAHEADRELYAAAKRRLAESDWASVQDYANAKSGVVLDVLERAYVEWRLPSDDVEYLTPTRSDVRVVLQEYDAVWARWYAVEEARIRAALGGVVLRLEHGWYEHRLLKRHEDPDVNLHVFSPACEEVDRMLVFRDFLRGDDGAREEYERTKRALAGESWDRVQDYADAKTRVVERIILRALA